MTFSVYRTSNWGGTYREWDGTQWVVVWEKRPAPPIGIVQAKDIQAALDIARQRYGRSVVVSTIHSEAR